MGNSSKLKRESHNRSSPLKLVYLLGEPMCWILPTESMVQCYPQLRVPSRGAHRETPQCPTAHWTRQISQALRRQILRSRLALAASVCLLVCCSLNDLSEGSGTAPTIMQTSREQAVRTPQLTPCSAPNDAPIRSQPITCRNTRTSAAIALMMLQQRLNQQPEPPLRLHPHLWSQSFSCRAPDHPQADRGHKVPTVILDHSEQSDGSTA